MSEAPHLHRVLEQRLQQLHHRRVLGAERRAQGAEIDRLVAAQVLLELLREAGDLLGAAIDLVEREQELRLGDHRRLDVALEDARQLVEGEEVGRVRHADHERRAALFQRHGAEAPRRGLRQLRHHRAAEAVALQVDVAQAELSRQRLRDLVLGGEPEVDEHAPEAPPRALLLFQREPELLLRDELLRHQDLAEPHALRARGGRRTGAGSRHVAGQFT